MRIRAKGLELIFGDLLVADGCDEEVMRIIPTNPDSDDVASGQRAERVVDALHELVAGLRVTAVEKMEDLLQVIRGGFTRPSRIY